jgi:hypothetical protein
MRRSALRDSAGRCSAAAVRSFLGLESIDSACTRSHLSRMGGDAHLHRGSTRELWATAAIHAESVVMPILATPRRCEREGGGS